MISPASDPLIARFAEACGANGPLDLRVELADGGVLAEGTVRQPFTLVGRDDSCDVTLTDPDVNLRHAWFQVIGGRVFATDLGSRTGLIWPDDKARSGWLDVGTPVCVGPFRIHLRSIPSGRLAPIARDYNPLHSDANLSLSRPSVGLEFRNGKRAKDRWTINRILTLVGRSDACKVHLNGDDISSFHCGLVLTPTGLWVVDLSGRGVVVNGERMRVAPLPHGSELWVGRFLIGCHYPTVGATPATGRPDQVTPPTPVPGLFKTVDSGGIRPDEALIPPALTDVPEDEVPLGFQPPNDPSAGLPSSHIMADAFRVLVGLGLAGNGPVSNPILVSGSGPPPPAIPVPPSRPKLTEPPPPMKAIPTPPLVSIDATSGPPSDTVIVPLLRQLGEMQGQMFEQFQQLLLLMMQAFGEMHREQMTALEGELSRIQELNAELGKLQADVARLTMARATDRRRGTESLTSASHDTIPLFELPKSGPNQGPDSSVAIREWVMERIDTLQRERQSRWQKLVGYFSSKPEN